MAWFNPNENLSPEAAAALKQLADCGESEAAAVAETLNDIASNDAESAADEFLIGCAQQIIEAAKSFIQEVGGEVVAEEELAAFATVQQAVGELYRSEITREQAEALVAQCSAESLAEFIIDAHQRGWVSNFNLGLNDDGEKM